MTKSISQRYARIDLIGFAKNFLTISYNFLISNRFLDSKRVVNLIKDYQINNYIVKLKEIYQNNLKLKKA